MATSSYTKIKILNFQKPFYKTKNAEFEYNFDSNRYLSNNLSEQAIDKNIKALCLKNILSIDFVFLLRCKISHSIFNTINNFYLQGVENNLDWDLLDLLPIFLEDNGERVLKIKKSQKFKFLSRKNFEIKDFNYSSLEEIKNSNSELKNLIYPFSGEIILSYDHLNSSNISTWTKVRTLGDNRLKKILHPYGKLLAISDWALLKATPNSTAIKAFEKFGKDLSILKILDKLLTSFKENYPLKKPRGWIPERQFLDKLKPRQKDNNLLLEIAKCIRKYKWVIFQKSDETIEQDSKNIRFTETLTDRKADEKLHENYNPSSFELYVLKLIKKETKNLLTTKIKTDYKIRKKYPERINAWIFLSKINTNKKYGREDFENILKLLKDKKGKSPKFPWLSKKFDFPNIANQVSNLTIKQLKQMTIECVQNPQKFIVKYEKNNKYNLYKEEIKMFSSFYIGKDKNSWGGFEHKTIFDDQKFIKNITLTISKYINPKKSRKEFLIKTVREIIKELKISSNSVNKG